ncbi:hypothetical protein EVAR_35727_1 [Eumeta japonica]|uniref:Uncharacterized protein n=1 Tax=Eumeta variegata TaxID=151549 RepID=A0A4C1VF88_EUMVA|nr:hypothetical protein EVAR_35727_1 [Eumeta japonica]
MNSTKQFDVCRPVLPPAILSLDLGIMEFDSVFGPKTDDTSMTTQPSTPTASTQEHNVDDEEMPIELVDIHFKFSEDELRIAMESIAGCPHAGYDQEGGEEQSGLQYQLTRAM